MLLDFQILVSFANCKCLRPGSRYWVSVHCCWGKLKIADCWPGTWSCFRSSTFCSVTCSLEQLCIFSSIRRWIYKCLLENLLSSTPDEESKLLSLQSAGSHRWASRVTSSCHRCTLSWWSLCWVSSSILCCNILTCQLVLSTNISNLYCQTLHLVVYTHTMKENNKVM